MITAACWLAAFAAAFGVGRWRRNERARREWDRRRAETLRACLLRLRTTTEEADEALAN